MIIDSLEKLNDIENTLILSRKLGAKFFQVSTALPLGRGRNLKLQFREEDVLKLVNLTEYLVKKYPSFFISNAEPLIDDLKNKDTVNCGAGYKSITIGPKGKIRPCPLSSDEFGIVGEIRNSFYEEVIELSPSVMAMFANLKAPDKEICSDCRYMPYCFRCFVRGLNKSKEVGEENCKWIKRNDVIMIKKYLNKRKD